MKFRISWPMGITIALVAFVIFILSFVFKVTFLDEYNHQLVSEDYYKDELNYQQEIDKLNNAVELKQNVLIEKTVEGLSIIFPSEFNPKEITGKIYFQRLSNSKIDFELPIKLETNTVLIKNQDLVEGKWNVKIEWKAKEKEYLLKQKINY
ncbi:FixH family protein [Lutibacter sp. TH_r2]|uniref:FixH family protein n=1 Tax=Lutibacter sp. TH_r2 TaxID=3082083 RepID=UPI002955DEDB|nr:FixH family protein [Lutibacter sp. TH_r2]MDV7188412.1 FixH family protein [Lutibacter sp. TH_r2]